MEHFSLIANTSVKRTKSSPKQPHSGSTSIATSSTTSTPTLSSSMACSGSARICLTWKSGMPITRNSAISTRVARRPISTVVNAWPTMRSAIFLRTLRPTFFPMVTSSWTLSNSIWRTETKKKTNKCREDLSYIYIFLTFLLKFEYLILLFLYSSLFFLSILTIL